jgi:cell wall assembly regulator SMI1
VAEADERRAIHLKVAQDTVPPPLAAQWEQLMRGCRGDPAGTLYPAEAGLRWLPEWLPVAGDGGGGGLFVDLRTGPRHGCVVAYTRTGQGPAPVWPGVREMLTDVADRFQSLDLASYDDGEQVVVGRWTLPNG